MDALSERPRQEQRALQQLRREGGTETDIRSTAIMRRSDHLESRSMKSFEEEMLRLPNVKVGDAEEGKRRVVAFSEVHGRFPMQGELKGLGLTPFYIRFEPVVGMVVRKYRKRYREFMAFLDLEESYLLDKRAQSEKKIRIRQADKLSSQITRESLGIYLQGMLRGGDHDEASVAAGVRPGIMKKHKIARIFAKSRAMKRVKEALDNGASVAAAAEYAGVVEGVVRKFQKAEERRKAVVELRKAGLTYAGIRIALREKGIGVSIAGITNYLVQSGVARQYATRANQGVVEALLNGSGSVKAAAETAGVSIRTAVLQLIRADIM